MFQVIRTHLHTYLPGVFAVCLYLHVMLGENEFLVFVNERNYFSPRRLLN